MLPQVSTIRPSVPSNVEIYALVPPPEGSQKAPKGAKTAPRGSNTAKIVQKLALWGSFGSLGLVVPSPCSGSGVRSNLLFFFRAFSPKIRGDQKLPKKVVFLLKKCKFFWIRHPIFFSQKNFIAPMRSKMHFAPKSTFSMEKWQQLKNILKNPQISEILLSYFLAQFFFLAFFFPWRLRCLGMFDAFIDFGAFFKY